jgi:hypothetical protein
VLTTPSITQFTAPIAMLATRWNLSCHAEHGANDVFDMTGNTYFFPNVGFRSCRD